jgi:hypothetical protein
MVTATFSSRLTIQARGSPNHRKNGSHPISSICQEFRNTGHCSSGFACDASQHVSPGRFFVNSGNNNITTPTQGNLSGAFPDLASVASKCSDALIVPLKFITLENAVDILNVMANDDEDITDIATAVKLLLALSASNSLNEDYVSTK